MKRHNAEWRAALLAALCLAALPAGVLADKGADIVNSTCTACHASGLLGAPKLGVAADWAARRAQGSDALVRRAIEGVNAMPPRGGNPSLSDEDVRAAVLHMLATLDGAGAAAAPPAAAVPAGGERQQLAASLDQFISAKPTAAAAPPAAAPKAAPAAPVRDATVVAAAPAATPKAPTAKQPVNTFNRLLQPASKRNPPPAKDGIHDPANEGTLVLQHPKEAFAAMPKGNSGNRVDWVKALESGAVQPRYDLYDPTKQPVVLDLNIVREVKGSMPDVVYPHKQHTEWLDCSNCHPAIFIPKKGANNISMASILLGEKCGVCHGKVAFPVAECRKCHSKNKARQ